MKQIFLLLAFFLPFMTKAQKNEGEVVYLETVKLQIDIPEGNEELAKMLPTSQSFHKTLTFNESASLYQDTPQTEEEGTAEVNSESEGMQFKMVIQRPENTYYADLESSKTLNSREFFGRVFLISGERKQLAWKMTGEQKKVLGYVCQKATCQDSTETIEAWFTPQISAPAGPDKFGGLPGLILELNLNNGSRTIVATKVELKSLPADALTKPTKGKEVTQAEFDKIEAEKMKEMEQEMGGQGGGVRMIIRN